jgi:cytidine diphosphoramidate kinase
MVIWITGMSGSGKTTLAVALRDLVKPTRQHTVLIDGDTIREAFGAGLGYDEPNRVVQINRIQKLAKILNDQDLIVIVAALYSHPDLLKWNRENFSSYTEVYLEASMNLLHKRDQKNLYSMAKSGQTNNVVGIDIPWLAPSNPDFRFTADEEIDPRKMAEKLATELELLRPIGETRSSSETMNATDDK